MVRSPGLADTRSRVCDGDQDGLRGGQGALAGAAGTLAMNGTAFTMRRLVEPAKPMGKTHYESVVEWAAGASQPSDQTRIRLGEVAHFGFGAFWGALCAVAMRNRLIKPVEQGTAFGCCSGSRPLAATCPPWEFPVPSTRWGTTRGRERSFPTWPSPSPH